MGPLYANIRSPRPSKTPFADPVASGGGAEAAKIYETSLLEPQAEGLEYRGAAEELPFAKAVDPRAHREETPALRVPASRKKTNAEESRKNTHIAQLRPRTTR